MKDNIPILLAFFVFLVSVSALLILRFVEAEEKHNVNQCYLVATPEKPND